MTIRRHESRAHERLGFASEHLRECAGRCNWRDHPCKTALRNCTIQHSGTLTLQQRRRAAAGAAPSFGGTSVPAAVASLFGGGSMPNPAFGAVTTPSFHFCAAASPFGAAAPAAGGLFSPAATPLGGATLFAAGQAGTGQPQFQIHIETGLDRTRQVFHSITKMPAYQVRTPNPNWSPNPTLTPARPNHNSRPEPRP